MAVRGTVPVLVSFAWTFGAIYGVEALANSLYLADSQTFFTISGLRLEALVGGCVLGSIAAGWALKGFPKAAAGQLAAVFAFLSLVYVVCDPRLCFSAGPDGLEPVRLGTLMISCVVAGSASGTVARVRKPQGRTATTVAALCTFLALAFFPVSFYFAGTRLLGLDEPYALVSLLGVSGALSGAVCARATGWKAGISVPVAGAAILFALFTPMATQYLPSVTAGALAGFVGVVAGAIAGSAVGSGPWPRLKSAQVPRLILVLALLLDLAMTLVILPDATTAAAPGGGVSSLPPVYVGGYMDSTPGHAQGVALNVSFAGTDPVSIQTDNYLAAGFGVHGAGCCVDGIDYAYRFDAYLFHNGTIWLAATGWEACDDNAACGGHSWKDLIFDKWGQMTGSTVNSRFVLAMEWSNSIHGPSINWYTGDGRTELLYASFTPPSPENHNFNTGVLRGGTGAWEQSASYFFQFGVMSAYPIGHSGWRAMLTCPETFSVGASPACVPHAGVVQGSNSFWKVIWKWGEDYPNVGVAASQGSVTFYYSTADAATEGPIW